jgi:hypothetical protein
MPYTGSIHREGFMDTTVIGALIGAVVSLIAVIFGWFLGSYDQRRRRKEHLTALSGALLMEALASAWHILNMREAMRQLHRAGIMPTLSDVEAYLPDRPQIYNSAGHHIAELGPMVAQALVEYHTHLERETARSKRLATIDGRRLRKEIRMDMLKQSVSDWGYVGWACAKSMDALLPAAKSNLTPAQINNVQYFSKELDLARIGKSNWVLDEWPVALHNMDVIIDPPSKPS